MATSGESGGDGGPVFSQAGGEAPQLADSAGFSLSAHAGSSLSLRCSSMAAKLRTRAPVALSSGQRPVMRPGKRGRLR